MNDRPPVLIVFTRYPEPGKSKTRLIPVLGADGAAQLQRRLIERTLLTARRAARRAGAALEIHYASGDARAFQDWLGPDLACRAQTEGDLGRRMHQSFVSAFAAGARSAILIGTDIPALSHAVLLRAFAALETHDAVFGPATDGGYYLVGLRRPAPEIFNFIPWSTAAVLAQTQERAKILGLSVALIDTLSDIDRPADLEKCSAISSGLPPSAGLPPDLLSVIIPTLNEAPVIGAALAELAPEEGIEIIVADGGSTDATPQIAAACGARVISAPRGRAAQMNAGAAVARGPLLLFLHADTLLPAGFPALVRRALARPGVAAGAFSFRLDEAPTAALRWVQRGANWRSRWLQLPYGDQALFTTAENFRRAGGFPQVPFMEDVAFVRWLGWLGEIVTLREPAITSARRWKRQGTLRTTAFHLGALMAYAVGVSPGTIKRWMQRLGYR